MRDQRVRSSRRFERELEIWTDYPFGARAAGGATLGTPLRVRRRVARLTRSLQGVRRPPPPKDKVAGSMGSAAASPRGGRSLDSGAKKGRRAHTRSLAWRFPISAAFGDRRRLARRGEAPRGEDLDSSGYGAATVTFTGVIRWGRAGARSYFERANGATGGPLPHEPRARSGARAADGKLVCGKGTTREARFGASLTARTGAHRRLATRSARRFERRALSGAGLRLVVGIRRIRPARTGQWLGQGRGDYEVEFSAVGAGRGAYATRRRPTARASTASWARRSAPSSRGACSRCRATTL